MATKRITDLTNVTSVQDDDLLIVETSEGTKSINKKNLIPEIVDNCNSDSTVSTLSANQGKYLDNRIDNLSIEVDDKYNNLSTEIEVERQRLNQFTSLAEGSTTGDAELMDIRIGADGVVYSSAGEAVRNQMTQLTNEANENKKYLLQNATENLCRDGKAEYKGYFGECTISDDGTYTLTSTNHYSRVDFRRYVDKAPKKFIFICKYTVPETSVLPMSVRACIYAYDSKNTNLDSANSNYQQVTKSGEYIYKDIINALEEWNDIRYLDIGLLIGTTGSIISFKKYVVLDVTDISDKVLSRIDFEKYLDKDGYFDKIDNFVFESQYAQNANISNFSESNKYNQFLKPILPNKYNYISHSGKSIQDVDISRKVEMSRTDTTTWGKNTAYVYNNLKTGKYILGLKLDEITFANTETTVTVKIGYQKSSLSGYASSRSQIRPIGGEDIFLFLPFVIDEVNSYNLYFEVSGANWDYARSTMYFYDVTHLSDDEIALIDKDMVINSTTVKWSVNAITAKTSEIAQVAETAHIAEVALNTSSIWKDKNILCIGDSITAAKRYQNVISDMLGANIYNHCKGGMGLIQCVDGENGAGEYDNETAVSGTLYALNSNDVKDMDLIIFFAGFNNRGTDDGKVGDCYSKDGTGQNTIAGYMQYCINRIYEELTEAGNLTCKLLIVTVDCSGKYPYIDADGYEEYPVGSGRTMETLANIQKMVSEANSIPCLDLWHNSGINRNTWSVFGAQANAVNEMYSPYKLDSNGNAVNNTRIRYATGSSYYQLRDGVIVLEEYTGSSPYPYNGDQLHKSSEGYKRIGEKIVGAIIKEYGN